MSNDHVGVPKFIEKGFSHDNQVMVFNVPLGKEYICNVDNLGVQRNYYEKDIEKDLLATNLEYKFSLFYSTFLSSNPAVFPEIIENNKELIYAFFRIMYMRSKQVLNDVNKYSITSKIFGDISHSELLRIESVCKASPIDIIDSETEIIALINTSNSFFVDNSIGFAIFLSEKKVNFFIPLQTKIGLVIRQKDSTYINKDYGMISNDEDVLQMNKYLAITEKNSGNGFIFGLRKEEIEDVKNLLIS